MDTNVIKKPDTGITSTLPDVQNISDNRGIAIDRVGINNVSFPLMVDRKHGNAVQIAAKVDMFASLLHDAKGTNMSRFVEVLMKNSKTKINSEMFPVLLRELQQRMEADDIYVKMRFPYFVNRPSPVTKLPAVASYDCAFIGILKKDDYKFMIQTNIVAANVCPCSKVISKYGAHNQRIHIKSTIIPLRGNNGQMLWLEDLIEKVEAQASVPVYPLLKRPDEKYVTEKGYDNPKFVEDVIRDLAGAFNKWTLVDSYDLLVEADESIHPHNASAYLQSDNYPYSRS